MCLSQCECAFTCVLLLQPCMRSVHCIDACVPDTVAAVTGRDAAAGSLQCCPKDSEGEYPYPNGPAPKNVPCFISSRRGGWEGGGCREATISVLLFM